MTSPTFALTLNLPSKSVWVPVLVPLINTLTPGKGSPVASVTLPVICFSCAKER